MGWQDRDYASAEGYSRAVGGRSFRGLGSMTLTTKLIVVNVVVFVVGGLMRSQQSDPLFEWGAMYTPAVLQGQVWRLITSQYLHAGVWHLLFNMLGLHFLGRYLEQNWSRRKFLLFYTACGLAGNLFYLLVNRIGWLAPLPAIGASGCVLGVLGACAVLFPGIQLIIYFFPMRIRTAAALFVGLYTLNLLQRGSNAGGDAAHLAGLFNAQGPNLNCLTACAASSQAIGEATELIRRGDVDIMLSGGAHSMIHPFGVTGFNLLTALSTFNESPQKASRPFDKNRDGFVLGEGAGMLVLEELDRAKQRGAQIHGEIIGYGSTADAYRITDIHPQGRGAIACIKMALSDARVNPEEIGYVNAHGTSTSVNDRVESLAIKESFGACGARTPVSSIKSMMGHLIAAAGSVEAIACLLAIKNNLLPPTINYETPDPDCDLDYVPNTPREVPVSKVLSNSFGFGGQNISLIFSEFKD
ncbi:MAG: rhomboid family intramembrane serine protease [Planctomycetes bacterium]|nr:rhomboid family intramembrane serine protease [Planctomycetota bacterium]